MIKTSNCEMLSAKMSNTVGYGPFKGMQLARNVWGGKHDIGNKLLGQYEYHVVERLVELSAEYDRFIDIGAADGYFAVGVARAGLYSEVICFEMNERGRDVISETAIANGIAGMVKICGTATEDSIRAIVGDVCRAVILCDIEGAEFDLLSPGFLEYAQGCTLIIELHDNFKGKSTQLRDELFERARRHFDIDFLIRSNPPVHSFEELNDLSDDSRMLVFSESRPMNMQWVCFTPKKQH